MCVFLRTSQSMIVTWGLRLLSGIFIRSISAQTFWELVNHPMMVVCDANELRTKITWSLSDCSCYLLKYISKLIAKMLTFTPLSFFHFLSAEQKRQFCLPLLKRAVVINLIQSSWLCIEGKMTCAPNSNYFLTYSWMAATWWKFGKNFQFMNKVLCKLNDNNHKKGLLLLILSIT